MLNFKQEYIKCYNDKSRIYFIENYLSTFNAMERKDVPFKLFPRQKVFLKSTVEYNNLVAIKHRQESQLFQQLGLADNVFLQEKVHQKIYCVLLINLIKRLN